MAFKPHRGNSQFNLWTGQQKAELSTQGWICWSLVTRGLCLSQLHTLGEGRTHVISPLLGGRRRSGHSV